MSDEQVNKKYEKLLSNNASDLIKFVGLCARIHQDLNNTENENLFPGVKTVISSGYRQEFVNFQNQQDYLSANFSFSNAYLAEGQLKGAKLYVDNYIIQLISCNRFAKNILKYTVFIPQKNLFDPLKDYDDMLQVTYTAVESALIEISLFRKRYNFRELYPRPTSYLQILASIEKELKRKKKILNSHYYYKKIFENIKTVKTAEEMRRHPYGFFNLLPVNLKTDLETIRDYLLTGKTSKNDYETDIVSNPEE
jgi:hypothetical protein